MKTPNEIKIFFLRVNEIGIDTLRVVNFTTFGTTEEEALDRVGRALREWITNADEGQTAWDNAGGFFNIDALLKCFDAAGNPFPSLKPYLEKEGVFQVKVVAELNDTDQVSSDRMLVNPDDL